MKETLILIDGHAIAYRAYYALTAGGGGERWITSDGEPTAGTYGFASILMRILEQNHPDYLAVAFDRGKTFRNEMYEGYKATRAKMPDDLRIQIERMRELVDALGVPRLEMDGFEADDILGSSAKTFAQKGYTVKIVTGDRDLLQLVDENVIVNLAGGKISDSKDYTPDKVKETLGVPPELVVDYKALVGDPSDNYPGVPGIGPKTAITLLETWGSVDNIYANLDQVKGAARTKLENGKESAFLSQTLARIKTDLPESFKIENAATANMNFPAAEKLFRTLQFTTLIPKLRKLAASFRPAAAQASLFDSPAILLPEESRDSYHPVFTVIDTPEKLRALAEKIASAEMLSFDTETTGIDPISAELVGISLAVKEGEGFYIPVGHRTGETQLPLETVRDTLGPVFADPAVKKAGHNIKYDLIVLKRAGFEVRGIAFDSMIAGWILEPTSKKLGLKQMAEALLNIEMIHIEELIGTGKKQLTMDLVPVEKAAPYAASDAEVVLHLLPLLKERMQKEDTEKIFDTLEIPLIEVLADMEINGMMIDTAFLKEMSERLALRISDIEEEIYQQVGYPFNINSTQQLSSALFDTLGLPVPGNKKKTASGHYSTAAEVLEEMRGIHPVIDLILENRELSKLKSTYTDTLPDCVDPTTGRIHTSFNQTGTVTGRLASSSPNLQNIPARTELGRQIREAFTASDGCSLLSVDYSQIELRILAHMSQDEAMLNAFRSGQDIHAATAAAIYRIPIEDVTKEMRRHAKAINFGLMYGMSAFGLSKSANLTTAEATIFVKTYFEQFPKVKAFLDGLKVQAAEQGYVSTIAGRKRYFPLLKTEMNFNIRSREEREAINAPVQGTSADILKAAMIRLPDALKEAGLKAKILLQVHDELLLECPTEELSRTREVVQDVMEHITTLSVPLITEAKWGTCWGKLAN